MKPAELATLQEIGAYLGAIAEDVAEATAVAFDGVAAAELMAGELVGIKSLLESLAVKFVDMHSAQEETNSRLNLYLRDAGQNEVSIRRLDSQIQELRKMASGQR